MYPVGFPIYNRNIGSVSRVQPTVFGNATEDDLKNAQLEGLRKAFQADPSLVDKMLRAIILDDIPPSETAEDIFRGLQAYQWLVLAPVSGVKNEATAKGISTAEYVENFFVILRRIFELPDTATLKEIAEEMHRQKHEHKSSAD